METEHGFYFFFAFTKKSKYHKFYKLKLKEFSNNEFETKNQRDFTYF